MKKRILAMLMAGMMVLTMAPAEVFAAEPTEQVLEVQEQEEEVILESEPESIETKEQEKEQQEPEENEMEPQEADKQKNEVITGPEESKEAESPSEAEEIFKEKKNSTEKEIEVRDAEPDQESDTVQTKAAKETKQEESIQNRTFPVGGLEKPKEIQLSEEAVQNLEVRYGEEDEIPSEGSQKYDSSWDIYSSNYIYNRLGTSEKKLWDALDYLSRRYLATNADAIQGSEVAYAREAIAYSVFGLSKQRASDIYLMFCYSNPQYYFIDSSYFIFQSADGVSIIGLPIYNSFATGTTRASYTAQMKSQINAWVSKVSKGSTEVQKAQIAHDLIINKVDYESGYPDNFMTPYHQSAFSVFCEEYTVCAGYTKAFEILMNGAGVDTIGVTSLGHAWNKICINDSWYNVDLTWDDLDGYAGEELYYMYFNRSDAKIAGELDKNGYHQMESMYSGVVPKCTLDSGITSSNMFTTGTYQKPAGTVKTPTITLDKSSRKYIKVTIKSESGADIYYTTDGINPSSSYSRSYRYTKPFTINSNVNLKVIAVKNTKKDSKIVSKKVYGKVYTVKFNSVKGSKVSNQKVYYNDKLKKPSNPKLSGYVFAGWYKDSKYKSAWNFNSKVTKNMTLYAKWAEKCTVKFNGNKGTVKTKSKSVGYKQKYGNMPQAVRSGYSFLGWYTQKSGGKKITENSKVTTKKTTTLYAHWKKVTVSKAAVSKVTNTAGLKMTVAIKKVSKAKGYQIRYSTKSNMKPAKTVLTGSTKKTIGKMSKGKKYYVQVRAYKVDSKGKQIFGGWSSKKSVTIKK